MAKLAPSILSADFSRLGRDIKAVEEAGADRLHFDVADGRFAHNITFGIPVIKGVRKRTGLEFEAHLMIESPRNFIEVFAEAGADIITVHLE
ncbi:MAG: ribulose-phosphate 3-epimerase, partial [Defluviitaleaceae bacterium]|nr:ribulose-phosphate 3-epimerase [Defluviitaleaceae bacterium]